jgi:hypothetical protein
MLRFFKAYVFALTNQYIIFSFVSTTSSWRTAYPLFFKEGKTRNEKRRKGNVGNRRDKGRTALEMAELHYKSG